MKNEVPDGRRFGFVAIVGAPNVGKSTFINHIIGKKISIVSPKAQTTRTNVLGIITRGKSQLVLLIRQVFLHLENALIVPWSTLHGPLQRMVIM